eukprot:tig00021590_g22770.t1
MAPPSCSACGGRAALRRPKTGDSLCRDCFFDVFEREIHETIVENRLFRPGDRVAIAASGGKDSTVLAHVLTTLNERHGYGLDLFLLSIDEGITGYRDDSIETVKRNSEQYRVPLKIVSYKDLYGWSMDDIVKAIGLKNNCTFCGVFRRQALDRGATLMKADKMATGHNADDVAETVLMNILRGDIARLRRCTSIVTGSEGHLPRCKPFKFTYEKEIVMYAYFKRLDYFSTECVYSPNAYRGYAREFLKDLEAIRPAAIIDVIRSGESFQADEAARSAVQGRCERCGYIASQARCKACVLLEGLNSGLPRTAIGTSRKYRGAAPATPGGGGGGALPRRLQWQARRRGRKEARKAAAAAGCGAAPAAAEEGEAEVEEGEGAEGGLLGLLAGGEGPEPPAPAPGPAPAPALGPERSRPVPPRGATSIHDW